MNYLNIKLKKPCFTHLASNVKAKTIVKQEDT